MGDLEEKEPSRREKREGRCSGYAYTGGDCNTPVREDFVLRNKRILELGAVKRQGIGQ